MIFMENFFPIAHITWKQYNKINFPIFPLPSTDIYSEDGLIRSCETDKVIDDLNQRGLTLGSRRLNSPHNLQRIPRFCGDSIDFFHTSAKAYIDNYGFIFVYERTLFTDVKFHKILKLKESEASTLLKVESVPFPVKVLRPTTFSWVGMLYIGKHPWIPYEYSTSYCKPLKRKI